MHVVVEVRLYWCLYASVWPGHLVWWTSSKAAVKINCKLVMALVCVNLFQCLMMLQLPFMEDIRQFVFASLPGENKSMQPTGK